MSLASCKQVTKEVTGSPPSQRQRFAAAVQGEDVYFFGGSNTVSNDVVQYYNDLYKLHVGENELTWEVVDQAGDIPAARDQANLCCVGNRLYLYGGKDDVDAKDCLPGLHIFHLGVGAWESVCNPLTASHTLGHTMDKAGDSLYIFGGRIGDVATADMYQISLGDNSWQKVQTKGETPGNRFDHRSSVVSDRYIYYFGGDAGNGQLYNDLSIFDTETLSWSLPKVKYNPPAPRSLHSFTIHRDKDIYVFGGQTEEGESDCKVIGDLVKLSLQVNLKWKRPVVSGNVAPPRCHHMAFIIHSHLYVFGGVTQGEDWNQFHVLQLINPSDRDTVVNKNHSSNTQKQQWVKKHPHSATNPDRSHNDTDISIFITEILNEAARKEQQEMKSVPPQESEESTLPLSRDMTSTPLSDGDIKRQVTSTSSIGQHQEGITRDMTSTPRSEGQIQVSISNECQGQRSSEGEQDKSNQSEKETVKKDADIPELRKSTLRMIEDTFESMQKEVENLQKEKKEVAQLKATAKEDHNKILYQKKSMQDLLACHQQTLEEMLRKRHREEKKESTHLQQIKKEIEEMKVRVSNVEPEN